MGDCQNIGGDDDDDNDDDNNEDYDDGDVVKIGICRASDISIGAWSYSSQVYMSLYIPGAGVWPMLAQQPKYTVILAWTRFYFKEIKYIEVYRLFTSVSH